MQHKVKDLKLPGNIREAHVQSFFGKVQDGDGFLHEDECTEGFVDDDQG